MKKEIKIALTAIVALVLFYIGLNFLKGINVFTSTNSYYVKFKDVVGLTVSSPVLANGYAVGIVRDIHYDYAENSNVLVKIELNTDMRVPQGTYAELETSMMGGVTMHLVPGKNPLAFLEPGDTVQGDMRQGMMEKAGEMMPTVMNMLPKVDSIMTNINRITGDSALLTMVQNLALITTNLQKTTQQLDEMMSQQIPALMTNVNIVAENLNKITGQVAQTDLQGTMGSFQATMKNAEQLTSQLNALTTDINQRINSQDNSLGLLLNNRSLYDNLSRTAESADSLLKDMKQHPGRYVHFSVFGKKDK